MTNLFVLFCVLNVVNVILQTLKSLATVKGSPIVAASTNALAYFIYTYVLIYTNIEGLTMLQKASVVACSNLIGVFVVKLIEKKMRKDKLWQIIATFSINDKNIVINKLEQLKIMYSYLDLGKHTRFEIYANNQKTSHEIAKIVKDLQGRYFINENKGILY